VVARHCAAGKYWVRRYDDDRGRIAHRVEPMSTSVISPVPKFKLFAGGLSKPALDVLSRGKVAGEVCRGEY